MFFFLLFMFNRTSECVYLLVSDTGMTEMSMEYSP